MPYDKQYDRSAGLAVGRDTPATDVVKLTSAMVSDSADLAIYAKALRVWVPASAGAVTLMVTPLAATDDTAAGAVPLTVPAGTAAWEPISVRRIWATGSVAWNAAGVEILLVRS